MGNLPNHGQCVSGWCYFGQLKLSSLFFALCFSDLLCWLWISFIIPLPHVFILLKMVKLGISDAPEPRSVTPSLLLGWGLPKPCWCWVFSCFVLLNTLSYTGPGDSPGPNFLLLACIPGVGCFFSHAQPTAECLGLKLQGEEDDRPPPLWSCL